MILLDSSQKYNTNYNETIAMQNMQQQYSRSHSHPAPAHYEVHNGTYNPSLQRPYSFTDGSESGLMDIHGEHTTQYQSIFSTEGISCWFKFKIVYLLIRTNSSKRFGYSH